MKRTLIITIVFLLFTISIQAEIQLPSILSDHMVLQQQTEVALWGSAEPGKRVIITPSWSKKKTVVKADSQSGEWYARVATPKAGGPYEITFSDGKKTTLRDVLIGEVWYCSGQSNMYMRMSGYPSSPVGGAADAVMTANPSTPIRICDVPLLSSVVPVEDTGAVWKENTPETVVECSALAWFFAHYLNGVLNVPVGILVSSSGGSSIESWLDRSTIEEQFAGEFDLSFLDNKDAKVTNQLPTTLFNGQVHALIPFTFKGILWYQGCTNVRRPEQYVRLQTAYVEMMRRYFQVPDASFYFVQLSHYSYNDPDAFTLGYFMEAQQKTLDLIPHSGMVVTTDLGIRDNIHPINKQDAAKRLAWLALQNDYGINGIQAKAPTYKDMRIDGNTAIVYFETYCQGNTASVGPRYVNLDGFEIAGEDKVFHKATAVAIWGNDVRVSSPEVEHPVAVRYCFRNWEPGNLMNLYGIPVCPFRTDDWDIER